MKKICAILLITSSNFSHAQKKFNLKNIDAGFGVFSVLLKNSPKENESGGLTANLNTAFALDKHLFSLNFIRGGGVAGGYVSIGGDFKFYKIDILYGREFNIFNWLAFDTNAGIGYYNQNSNTYFTDDEIKKSTVNFPIKMSLVFLQHRRIGLGINSNYDINKLNNTFSGNLFLRYNFIK